MTNRCCVPGSRRSLLLAALGVFVWTFGSGCSAPPEETLLSQFFRALAQDDRVSAAGLSMAAFPGESVDSWEILEVGEIAATPYRVPDMREEENAAEAARDQQFKVFYDFRQANRESLEAITARRERDPEAAIAGRLGEIAAAWDEHSADRRRLVSSLSATQLALEEERRQTQRSLLREAPVDYLTGVIQGHQVLVETVENGSARRYEFHLVRYDLLNQHGAAVPSRWIIAAIEPVTND